MVDNPKASTKINTPRKKKSLRSPICPPITKINPELNFKAKHIVMPHPNLNLLLNPK